MRKILFIASLILSNYGICQFTSMIDVAKGKWDYQRSGVAASILIALEKGEPEVAMQFFKNKEKIKIKELTAISKLILKLDTISPGFPPVYINKDTSKNSLTYQRIYYKRLGAKREYLFQVNIYLDGNEFNLRADSIKFTKEVNLDSINYLLEMIRCGSYPPGPPAHTGFYNWKERYITTPLKEINFKKGEKIPDNLLLSNGYRFSINLEIGNGNLPNEKFWNLSNIETLRLSGDFKELPNDIGNLKSLKKLRVSSDQLQSIPVSIGRLTQLVELRIYAVNCTKIPDEIGNLSNLKEVYIESFELGFLPESIGNLINIENFDLTASKLVELPTSIGNLINLENFKLSARELRTLPHTIGNLRKLKSLSLSFAKSLKNFPKELGNIETLERLHINGSGSIPKCDSLFDNIKNLSVEGVKNVDEIVNFIGLKTLFIRRSEVEELPIEINKLSNLESLELSGCKTKFLPETLTELKNLRSLEIGGPGGNLDSFPEFLTDMATLRHLRLSVGKIKEIPKSISKLIALEELNLGYNEIEEVPIELFSLPNLKSVFLSRNKIAKLPDNIEKVQSASNFRLALSENPIDISYLKDKKLSFQIFKLY